VLYPAELPRQELYYCQLYYLIQAIIDNYYL